MSGTCSPSADTVALHLKQLTNPASQAGTGVSSDGTASVLKEIALALTHCSQIAMPDSQ